MAFLPEVIGFLFKDNNDLRIEEKLRAMFLGQVFPWIKNKLRYRVREMMEEFGMSFLTSDNQRRKTLELLKTFSKSVIVKTFKKENKIFTIPEIHKHMKEEISIASLYNYSVEISQLGIPLKTNKIITNHEQYNEKDIVNSYVVIFKKSELVKFMRVNYQKSEDNYPYQILDIKILEYKDYIKRIYDIDVFDFEKK